jgi:hypothetical protein
MFELLFLNALDSHSDDFFDDGLDHMGFTFLEMAR